MEMDFRLRERNLIMSTLVAEEGIDVRGACGGVIRWDRLMNMASWRARRRRSTFVIMFEEGGVRVGMRREDVMKWERLEAETVARYVDADDTGKADEADEAPFCVESTGALLTLQSAIPHLNHFCAFIPPRGHVVY
ncbi:hypothetical protein GYMLUDRAFT_414650 [Collybiopsis luxurians FD-317 M1]|nr:hypothetical protein GYMLUDRAFT_414650 [Collybiopsis luxurians FD-317 M1]